MELRVPKLPKETYERLQPDVREWVDAMMAFTSHLLDRIQDLEGRLAKNSSNSSKPPSSDGLAKPNRTQSERKPSGRKPGGQPGRNGASLKQVKNPNRVVLHPVLQCECCQSDLNSKKPSSIDFRQVFDLPPMSLHVTEHQGETKRCHCGHLTSAIFPEGVTSPVQYGPEIKSLAVYLNTFQLIPYKRINIFFEDVFGYSMSPATVKGSVDDVAVSVEGRCEEIKNAVIASALGNFDETGLRVNKQLYWMHVASNERLTYYDVHPKRGVEAMNDIGILPLFKGKAVHDAWAPYYEYNLCAHYLCNAHHLRELTFIFEAYDEKWAKRMHELLLEIHGLVAAHKESGKPALSSYLIKKCEIQYEKICAAAARYHGRLEPLEVKNKRGRKKQRPGKNLLDRLDQRRDQVLGFMHDFSIPFSNNQGEQDLRMQKVKQKISGCFRTFEGAKNFCRIRTYLSTARKQGHRLLETIRLAVIGQPMQLVT